MIHIDEIEAFFKKRGFPDFDVSLSKCETVKAENSRKFIETNIATLRAQSGKKGFVPYCLSLNKYYQIVNDKKQGIY